MTCFIFIFMRIKIQAHSFVARFCPATERARWVSLRSSTACLWSPVACNRCPSPWRSLFESSTFSSAEIRRCSLRARCASRCWRTRGVRRFSNCSRAAACTLLLDASRSLCCSSDSGQIWGCHLGTSENKRNDFV